MDMRRSLLALPLLSLAATLVVGCGSAPNDAITASDLPSTAPATPLPDDGTTSSPVQPPNDGTDYVGFEQFGQDQAKLPAQCRATNGQTTKITTAKQPYDAAYICTVATRRVKGDGIWQYDVVWRITGGMEDVLAAYSQPDEKPPAGSNLACTAIGYAPQLVWLHDGPTIRAIVEARTACGGPQDASTKAFQAMKKSEVSAKRIQRVQSEQSIETKCPDNYKLPFEAQYGWAPTRSGPQDSPPRPLGGDATACIYRPSKDRDGDPVGSLARAVELSGSTLQSFNAELAKSQGDPSCKGSADSTFAVLMPVADGGLVVEVDGCAVANSSFYWQATDGLRSLLK